jgi:hypothetical protein
MKELQIQQESMTSRGFHSWLRNTHYDIWYEWGLERPNFFSDGKFYWRKTHPGPDPVCLNCGGPAIFSRNSWLKYCGVACANSHEPKKQETVKTLLKNYGVDHPLKSLDVQRKVRQTFLSHYGEVGDPRRQSLREKFKATYKRKYGVLHPLQRREIVAKQKKSAFGSYSVEFRNKVLRVQGYERFVVKDLESCSWVKDLTTEAPSIPYCRLGGSHAYEPENVYHPDLLLTRRNGGRTLIEVKSVWTLRLHAELNLTKFDCARKFCQMYDYEFVLAVVHKGQVFYVKEPNLERIRRVMKIIREV